MKNNTIVSNDGIEVYDTEIDRLVDDYIGTLNDENDIKNRITFSGLMRYIYNNLFKPTKDMVIRNNRNSILDYSDIALLMDVYNKYIDVCCKYKQEYTLNKFCNMTGISSDTIRNWQKGIKVPTVEGVSSDAWVCFAKKISENSEQALSESMLNGNLMAYAQLKCWYNWKEEPQQIAILSGSAPKMSESELEQIASKQATIGEITPDF